MTKSRVMGVISGYVCEYTEEHISVSGPVWLVEKVSQTIVHVYPANDLREHIFAEYCHCKPIVKPQGLFTRVIHNSYDGREAWEKLEELISGRLNL